MANTAKLVVLLCIFLVLLLLVFRSSTAQYCPPADSINPCTCNNNNYFCNNRVCAAQISCCDLNDGTMENVLQNAEYQFPYVVFCNLRVSHFPATSFSSKKYNNLVIRDSNIDTLFEATPSDNSLEQLDLENILLLTEIQWNLLASFDRLTSLTIRRVQLPIIDDSFGRFLSKRLVNLDISQTQTTLLGDNVFAPFSNLVRLSISDNDIKTIKRSMLPNPSRLVTLTLRRCNIQSLPDDFLAGMFSITRLELDGNQISTLSQSIFGRSPPMSIEVGGNPVICDCQMKWMARRGFLPHISGYCAGPDNLRGRNLYGLGPFDFRSC